MFSRQHLSRLLLLSALAASVAAEPAATPRDRFGDPLPNGAIARLGNMRLRPDSTILGGAFSPDGRVLATIGANGAITCWDTTTGKAARRLSVKLPGPSRVLRFNADGKSLIFASGNALRWIDALTGAEQRKLDSPNPTDILALDVAKDGKIAVTIQSPGSILVWNLAAGRCLHTFKAGSPRWQNSSQQLAALTSDGKQLVLPHADGSLHLLDVASGQELLAFDMPPKKLGQVANQAPQKIAISPDGRYLAYASIFNAAVLCDLKTGKRLRELSPPQAGIYGLAFSPNSRFLAVCSYADVRVFGVVSGKELRRFVKPPDSSGAAMFSPDGRKLAVVSNNSAISLWDVADERPVHPPVGHRSTVWALVFFPDGKRLASAGRTDGLIAWDSAVGQDIAHQRTYFPFSSTVTMTSDGTSLQYLGTDLAMHRWNPATGDEERQPLPRLPGSHQFALAPDGHTVAALNFVGSQQLALYDLRESRATRTLTLPRNARILQVMFSPDSRRLAATAPDGVLRLWDCASGRLVDESKSDTRRRHPVKMDFAADGRSLALFDGDLCIREIASGGDRFHLSAPGIVTSLTYSANGRLLAYGHADGHIIVHDIGTGKQRSQWQGQQGAVYALAFSRDSRLLASGGDNGTILVWKIPDGENLPAMLKAEEAAAFWQTLAVPDAARTHRALARLAAAPAQTLPLIQKRFRTKAIPPTPERLARLIAELEDDSFKVRERATRELSEVGSHAADALRKALANDPSAETRRRIESVLKSLQKNGDPEHLRCLRALEVLERIGTPQARSVLRELAEKDLDTTLREEVRSTLRRMEQRR